MATLQDQLNLEKSCYDLGVEKYRADLKKFRDKEVLSRSRHGHALIYNSIDAFRQLIDEDRKKPAKGRPPMLAKTYPISSDKLAFIALRVLLDRVVNVHGKSILVVAIDIGQHVLTEKRLLEWRKGDKDYAANMIRLANKKGSSSFNHKRAGLEHKIKADGVELTKWSEREVMVIGLRLIDCLIRSVGLIERVPGYRSEKTRRKVPTKIYWTESAEEWVKKFNDYQEVQSPYKMPLMIPPKKWDSLAGGGYYSPHMGTFNMYKRSRADLDVANLKDEFKALNLMQETQWRVNTDVLNVMQEAWEGGDKWVGLPARDDLPLPVWPNEKTKEEMEPEEFERFVVFCKQRSDVRRHNSTNIGHRINMMRLFKEAQQCDKWGSLWFPWQCDFRGRKYPICGQLNPQGADHQKALLEFGVPALIENDTDARWLAIHGANLFGVDKISLEDREMWAYLQGENVVAVMNDPLGNRWWTEADKPWQALAWCFEWAGYLWHRQEGIPFETRLPCASDGTCNGLQHLSALLRDYEGGKSVNLVPGALPRDIYSDVAEEATESLQRASAEGNETAIHWLNIGIDRKMTKRPVMIVPYSGTKRACFQYIKDAVEDKVGNAHPFGDNLTDALAYLTDHIWRAIQTRIVAAPRVMGFVQDIALAYFEEGKTFGWTTPTGVRVELDYQKSKSGLIQTQIDGKLSGFRINERISGTMDKAKIKSSASPNFIHALDAAAMTLAILKAKEGYDIIDFAMVHDSFATHAPMMGQLNEALREAFVEMYQADNWLARLYQEAKKTLVSDSLPDVPLIGCLDIYQVLESEYFFS